MVKQSRAGKVLTWLGGGLAALLLAGFVALATWEPFAAAPSAPPPARAYSAEIIRDEFGVPHISGRTDADAAFGIAIAHAEDDFFTLQDVLAMARGRYGAIAGEKGAQVDYAYHLLDARGTAEREYPRLPADTRALFDAYAAGLNRYAAAHPREVKLGRLFPISGVDVAAGFALRQPFFFGLDQVIGPLVAGEPLRPESALPIPGLTPARQTALALPLPGGEDGALAGSNAFAIAPKKSGDGVTRLVSNAHQPWRGGVAWYELRVESGQGWHFAGASFPGSPYPFLGHNEHLGWTNTVNRPDLIDIYRLVLNKAATHYRLDGRWLPLASRTITLPVKVGPLTVPIRRTIHRSVHGPVIRNSKGAFAIRYAGMGSLAQLDAYYRLNKARSLAEWEAVLARMAIPSTNFLYADAAGNVAYVYNAVLPDRPRGYDWRGILPGDISAAIWRRPVRYEALPRYVNPASGWLFNANNAPFSAAGPGSDLSQSAFDPVLGIEAKTTNRARRAARLMAEADVIDRPTLERIKYDTGYERSGYVGRALDEIAALHPRGDRRLAAAQALLARWDLTADNIGRADALALIVLKDFMSAEYQNKPWPDAREELAEAAAHLMRHFGRIDPPMSEVLRLRQKPGPHAVDLPLDGGSDTLRASTTWDVEPDGRLAVRHGDSFVMFAEWAPGQKVRSQSIQPFGAATTRPGSTHFTDQSTLFVQHRLKPVHFWRADILANTVSRKRVTNAPARR